MQLKGAIRFHLSLKKKKGRSRKKGTNVTPFKKEFQLYQ